MLSPIKSILGICLVILNIRTLHTHTKRSSYVKTHRRLQEGYVTNTNFPTKRTWPSKESNGGIKINPLLPYYNENRVYEFPRNKHSPTMLTNEEMIKHVENENIATPLMIVKYKYFDEINKTRKLNRVKRFFGLSKSINVGSIPVNINSAISDRRVSAISRDMIPSRTNAPSLPVIRRRTRLTDNLPARVVDRREKFSKKFYEIKRFKSLPSKSDFNSLLPRKLPIFQHPTDYGVKNVFNPIPETPNINIKSSHFRPMHSTTPVMAFPVLSGTSLSGSPHVELAGSYLQFGNRVSEYANNYRLDKTRDTNAIQAHDPQLVANSGVRRYTPTPNTKDAGLNTVFVPFNPLSVVDQVTAKTRNTNAIQAHDPQLVIDSGIRRYTPSPNLKNTRMNTVFVPFNPLSVIDQATAKTRNTNAIQAHDPQLLLNSGIRRYSPSPNSKNTPSNTVFVPFNPISVIDQLTAKYLIPSNDTLVSPLVDKSVIPRTVRNTSYSNVNRAVSPIQLPSTPFINPLIQDALTNMSYPNFNSALSTNSFNAQLKTILPNTLQGLLPPKQTFIKNVFTPLTAFTIPPYSIPPLPTAGYIPLNNITSRNTGLQNIQSIKSAQIPSFLKSVLNIVNTSSIPGLEMMNSSFLHTHNALPANITEQKMLLMMLLRRFGLIAMPVSVRGVNQLIYGNKYGTVKNRNDLLPNDLRQLLVQYSTTRVMPTQTTPSPVASHVNLKALLNIISDLYKLPVNTTLLNSIRLNGTGVTMVSPTPKPIPKIVNPIDLMALQNSVHEKPCGVAPTNPVYRRPTQTQSMSLAAVHGLIIPQPPPAIHSPHGAAYPSYHGGHQPHAPHVPGQYGQHTTHQCAFSPYAEPHAAHPHPHPHHDAVGLQQLQDPALRSLFGLALAYHATPVQAPHGGVYAPKNIQLPHTAIPRHGYAVPAPAPAPPPAPPVPMTTCVCQPCYDCEIRAPGSRTPADLECGSDKGSQYCCCCEGA